MKDKPETSKVEPPRLIMQVSIDHEGRVLIGGDMETLKDKNKVFYIFNQVFGAIHKMQKTNIIVPPTKTPPDLKVIN